MADGLTTALGAIEVLGIRREDVLCLTLGAVDRPEINVTHEEFRRLFAGRVVEPPRTSGEWEHLELVADGVTVSACRRIKPPETKRVVV